MLIALLGLTVHSSAMSKEIDVDKLVDQKNYKLGPSAFFASYIDNYISQKKSNFVLLLK